MILTAGLLMDGWDRERNEWGADERKFQNMREEGVHCILEDKSHFFPLFTYIKSVFHAPSSLHHTLLTPKSQL